MGIAKTHMTCLTGRQTISQGLREASSGPGLGPPSRSPPPPPESTVRRGFPTPRISGPDSTAESWLLTSNFPPGDRRRRNASNNTTT